MVLTPVGILKLWSLKFFNGCCFWSLGIVFPFGGNLGTPSAKSSFQWGASKHILFLKPSSIQLHAIVPDL